MKFQKKITDYCEKHTTGPDPVLKELERVTHLRTLSPQMITGPLQGGFLTMLSTWLRPKNILEIGTFTGYGAICLARGLRKGGTLHTIEVNPEVVAIASEFFQKAGLDDRIIQHVGDAHTIIPGLTPPFDLVYIDAGKDQYTAYYDLVIDRVSKGGVILADNVLWDGKVGRGLKDRDTQKLELFNDKVHEDTRVDNLLIPIRDGIMLAQKK